MICLPIGGERAHWRTPTGHDDIALADSRPGLAGARGYVAGAVAFDSQFDPGALPVGDLDLLIVLRRRELRGDALVAEGRCDQCAAPVDVQFSLAEYAHHHRPRPSRLAAAGDAGWFSLRSGTARFRVPVVEDVLAVIGDDDPRAALLGRCARGDLTPRAVRSIERALATLAPTLRADVVGTCPECSAPVLLDVDARELCMAELRFLAGAVYDDVNLIASVYRWTHDAILDLPSGRRRRYADNIAGRPAGLMYAGVPVE